MDVFDLYAKIGLDTKDYEKKVKEVKGSSGGLAKAFEKIGDITGKINLKSLASGLSSVGNGIKNIVSSAGKIAVTGFGAIAGAATAAGGALLAIEANTEEYRVAQGKLNTAFDAAGLSSDAAKQSYEAFYGILGDTDTATEASQLLAKLVQNEKDISEWTDISAGVWGTFGDALPIEGLIESANETAKVGEVTGSLADALNWAGISEDDFNTALSAAGSESERNRLIMETLSSTYEDATEAFYKNNESIVKAREAQAKMDETLAKLGGTVSNIKSNLIAEFLPAISEVVDSFNDLLTGTEGAEEKFSNAIGNLIDKGVEKLPEFIDFGLKIITSIANGIIQNIPKLLSEIFGIIGEQFPIFMDNIINFIENDLPTVLDNIGQIILKIGEALVTAAPLLAEAALALMQTLADYIVENVPAIVEALPKVIDSIIEFFTQDFPQFVEAGAKIVAGLIDGILSAIPGVSEAWQGIKDGASETWNSITQTWNNAQPYFEDIWNNIKQVFGEIKETLINFFSEAWDAIKVVWDDFSPYFSEAWAAIKETYGEVVEFLGGVFQKAWETIRDIWNSLKEHFSGIWQSIKEIYNEVKPYFDDIWETIKKSAEWCADNLGAAFKLAWTIVKNAWDVAVEFFDAIWTTIEGIFAVVADVLGGNFSDAWEEIKKVFDGWGEFFGQLWQSLLDIFGGAWEAFKEIGTNIVKGIWEGISGMFSWLSEKVGGFLSGIFGGAQEHEEIHSPSKKWARIGRADAQGIGVGFSDEFRNVKNQINGELDFLTPSATSSFSFSSSRNRANYGNGGMIVNVTVESGVISSTADADAIGRIIGEKAAREIRYKGGVVFA